MASESLLCEKKFIAGPDNFRKVFFIFEELFMAIVSIKPKNKNTRFVALDAKNPGTILVEGIKAESVARRARATGKAFAMLYVPKNNETHGLHGIAR